jgi:hypothetical protein
VWGVALLIASELFLAPAAFGFSEGERIVVEFRREGGSLEPETLRDCGLVTESAVYNILNLRSGGPGVVLGDASIKRSGTLLLYVRRGGASAKSLVNSGEPTALHGRVLGLPLEIVPERNPYAARPGEDLTLRVLASGNPAPGASIAIAGGPPVQVDAAGRTSISLRSGVQRIVARRSGLVSTLTFAVKAPETR